MKKTYLIIFAIAVVALGGMYLVSKPNSGVRGATKGTKAVLLGQEITVYKTKTCGCCRVYTQYLEREDANVKVVDVADLSAIKKQYGVPTELQSCHTSVIGGYVVEGHIPLEVIEKLLAEKPTIKGIALPGMPSGSPGMPGPKTETWTIYAIGNDGTATEFMSY